MPASCVRIKKIKKPMGNAVATRSQKEINEEQ
jgi:hypothetical protein